MDLSALDNISKGLEYRLDSLGGWLTLFTALVVLGLVMEYWHPIVDFWELLTRPAALFPWKELMELTGALFVTIGVAGELFIQFRASYVELDLRKNSHRIESLLNEKASSAQLQAEREASERVKLQAKILASFGPRRLTEEQSDRISSKLRNLKGMRADVYMFSKEYPWASDESKRLAFDISKALRRARIDSDMWGIGENCGWASGVVLFLPPILPPEAKGNLGTAKQIVEALKPEMDVWPEIESTLGVACPGTPLSPSNKRKDDAIIKIMVGRKPSPILRPEDLRP